jgi:predicted metal-dependent peptidase
MVYRTQGHVAPASIYTILRGFKMANNFSQDGSEKIAKGLYDLMQKKPFFGYLCNHLDAKRDDKAVGTLGVDARGRLYFNEAYTCKLTPLELTGVLVHEVMHVALLHFVREGNRDYELCNLAEDAVINYIVLVNGFKLPSCEAEVDVAAKTCTIGEYVIQGIDTKSWEDVYDELNQNRKKIGGGKGKGGKGKSSNGDLPGGFDVHIRTGMEEGKAKSMGGGNMPGNIDPKDWAKILAEAEVFAMARGDSPLGVGLEIGECRKSKLPWKAIVRKEISQSIPTNITYGKLNRTYLPLGMYFPGTLGEKVSIIVSFDTSGSMSKEDRTVVVSELLGAARAFPAVSFHLVTHDADVHDDIIINTSNANKIRNIEIHGGGGSKMEPLYDYIKSKRAYNSTLLIAFTDGQVSYPKKPTIPTLVVLVGTHCPKGDVPRWAKVIDLD